MYEHLFKIIVIILRILFKKIFYTKDAQFKNNSQFIYSFIQDTLFNRGWDVIFWGTIRTEHYYWNMFKKT